VAQDDEDCGADSRSILSSIAPSRASLPSAGLRPAAALPGLEAIDNPTCSDKKDVLRLTEPRSSANPNGKFSATARLTSHAVLQASDP
jgi:hypothetical protein